MTLNYQASPRSPCKTASVTVLICTLNEQGSLPYVLSKINDWVDEIIIVDGHSTDATVEKARKFGDKIKIFYQSGKGKGDAIKYGVSEASGDIIVTLDADGSTDPAEIENFITPLMNGYDFAKGSRLINGRPRQMTYRRWIGNKLLAMATNILNGTNYTDVCSGYNAFRKESFLKLQLKSDGFQMEQEMNARLKKKGLKAIEVPTRDNGRISGQSKTIDVKQGFIDLFTIILERLRG